MDCVITEPKDTVRKYAWTIQNFKDIADNWKDQDSVGYDFFPGCCRCMLEMDRTNDLYFIAALFQIGDDKWYTSSSADNDIKKHIEEKHSIEVSSWTAYIVHQDERKHVSCSPSIEKFYWSANRAELDKYFGTENGNGSLEFRAELKMTQFTERQLKIVTPDVRPSHWDLDFGHLLRSKELCDFTIKTSHKSLRVHKAVLAARSPVFRAMLRSDMRESRENLLKLDHVSTQVVKKFVHYIYTDKLEFVDLESAEVESPAEEDEKQEDEEDWIGLVWLLMQEEEENEDSLVWLDDIELAVQLICLADQYELLRLRELCERHLNEQLKKENVCKILKLADSHRIDSLRSPALKFAGFHRDSLATEDLDAAASNSPQLRKDILAALTGKLDCHSEWPVTECDS